MPPHPDSLPQDFGRISLRRLAGGDLAAFQAYRLDPAVALYQDWPAMTDAEALAFLQEMGGAKALRPGAWFQAGIADRRSGALIGDLGVCLSVDGTEAEIGVSLHRSFQGQGLASEALRGAIAWIFEATGVQRIVAVADARNESAHLLLAAVGMARIEVKAALFRGEPCTELVFALRRAPSA